VKRIAIEVKREGIIKLKMRVWGQERGEEKGKL
jgi:hypothetical protein